MKVRGLRSCFLALAMLSMVFVSACGSGAGNGSAGTNEGQNEKTGENYDKPTTLVFYSIARDSEQSFNERMGDAIRKRFPNLTVKYVQRTTANDLPAYISSGEKLDLVWGSLGSWPQVQDLGLAIDLTDLIKKHNIDLSTFEPSSIDAMKQMGAGQILALPFENHTKVVYYNKDIFDKFGVEYPKDGMKWPEFHALAKKLNREDSGNFYTGYSPSVNSMFIQNELSLPFFQQSGSTVRSTFNDPGWKTIIENEFLAMARETGYHKVMDQYRNGGVPNLDTFTKNRALAMYPEGPLLPIVLPDDMAKLNWDIVAMPTLAEKPGVGYQAYPTYMSISTMSQEKDMAMQVIKFLTSKEFQTTLSKSGDMTILKDPEIQRVMGQDSKFKGKNYGAFFYNKFAPIATKFPIESKVPGYTDVTNKLAQLAKGELDINTALRQAEEAVNKKVDEQAAK